MVRSLWGLSRCLLIRVAMNDTPPFRFKTEDNSHTKILWELFRFIWSPIPKMFDPNNVGDFSCDRSCDLFDCDRTVDVLRTSPVLPGTHGIPTVVYYPPESTYESHIGAMRP